MLLIQKKIDDFTTNYYKPETPHVILYEYYDDGQMKYCRQYDERGNEILFKDIVGYEREQKFDEANRLSFRKDNQGYVWYSDTNKENPNYKEPTIVDFQPFVF